MPRLTLTRLVLLVAALVCLMLLVVNVWHQFEWRSVADTNHIYRTGRSREHNTRAEKLKSKRVNQLSDELSVRVVKRHDYRVDISNCQSKPWFMANGTVRPGPHPTTGLAIWPEESPDDRIVSQLMYYPNDYDPTSKKLKTILLYMGRGGWADLPMGRTKFIKDRCPVDRCYLSNNPKDAETADAVFFKERFQWPRHRRPAHQIWILFLLECPLHTQLFRNLGSGVFNWTATYRHDSDIVAPYEKFVAYNTPLSHHSMTKDWSYGKSKQVAWFVSNCGARNKRLEYARQLSRYIQVDIYGSCGNKKCPRNKAKECFQMLNRDYKFYLAFENSNCRDYITEKFFVNGLGHNSLDYNLIPIVMGAHPTDYLRASPYRSYIHVDDFESPKHLAEYLHQLSADPKLYNQYFEWKSSGEFINTYFWCRVCALLHSAPVHQKPSHSYEDISKWWTPDGICNSGQHKWDSNQ